MLGLRRSLQRSIAYYTQQRASLQTKIDNTRDETTAFNLKKIGFLAFGNSHTLHQERLTKRFSHLQHKRKQTHKKPQSTITNNANPPDTSDLVTDLTASLDQQERSLLAKGPKYLLAKKLDRDTTLDIRTAFCRFSYQVRWQQVIDHTNRGDDIPTILSPATSRTHHLQERT